MKVFSCQRPVTYYCSDVHIRYSGLISPWEDVESFCRFLYGPMCDGNYWGSLGGNTVCRMETKMLNVQTTWTLLLYDDGCPLQKLVTDHESL
jgi:hypothetical protein